MGDRGNIIIKQEEGTIYFYTHWHGSDLPTIVQAAIARRLRWDDESYLARIIFCGLVGKEDFEGETGYGISLIEIEQGSPTVTVDIPAQEVRIDGAKWSFEEFTKQQFV